MVQLYKNKKGKNAAGESAKRSTDTKKMASRNMQFLLMVGDDGAILVLMEKKKVVRRLYAPSPDAENIKSFIDLLDNHPAAPLLMLVDVIDQSYVRHTLPPVSPLGVNKLVNMRLVRDFSPEDITGYISLGRETSGRKDWNFLLIALANSEYLQKWIKITEHVSNPFKGVYLVPVEAQLYIKEIAKRIPKKSEEQIAEWKILVTHNKVSGFRQVVLHNDKLVFTRLAQPMGDASAEVVAGNVEQEVLNTVEYLRRLGFNEQAGMDVFVVVSQEIKESIDSKKFNANSTYVFTPYEMSNHLGLQQAALSADRFGDVVMAASFGADKKHLLKLNTSDGYSIEKLYLARSAIKFGSILVVLFCIAYAAFSLLDYFRNTERAETLRMQKTTKERELVEVKKILNNLPADVTYIADLVSAYEHINSGKKYPTDFVSRLSNALVSGIVIRDIKWVGLDSLSEQGIQGQQTNTSLAKDVNVELTAEFLLENPTKNEFLGLANTFLQKLEAEFSDYSVEYSRLPGMVSADENMQINFDDEMAVNDLIEGKLFEVDISITGPNKDQASANENTFAPVEVLP